MPPANDRARWERELLALHDRMQRLYARPGLANRSLGVPEWDWQLWRIGREWLAGHDEDAQAPGEAPRQGDVYLATKFYEVGGHTALLGDFVRALDGGASQDAPAHIILTNVPGETLLPISDAIQRRVGVPADRITVLPGPSLVDRLDQLFTTLRALRPRRLFLFHHPFDPLASAVAQPSVAALTFVVHHADAVPSFGLHLPGVRIIDLSPQAAATTRLLGRVPALLRLTAPDPGPRPRGFLTRGHVVTATSGNAYKFSRPYAFDYADIVGVILRTTEGWHVHIGPLDEAARSGVQDVLSRQRLSADRFVHVPWTDSVTRTLWEHDCDVYCASFPFDGARARIEVMASATPYLRHSTSPDVDTTGSQADLDDRLVWRTGQDLETTLRRLSNPAILEEESSLLRQVYDSRHHPHVFARELGEILAGGSGADDPHAAARKERAAQSMMRALTTALMHEPESSTVRRVRARLRRLLR